jgi:hypothetical protein
MARLHKRKSGSPFCHNFLLTTLQQQHKNKAIGVLEDGDESIYNYV